MVVFKNICYGSISHWYKKMYNFREGILFHIFPVLILFKNNFLFLIVCSTGDVCFGCYMIIRSFQFIGQNIYEERSDQVCILVIIWKIIWTYEFGLSRFILFRFNDVRTNSCERNNCCNPVLCVYINELNNIVFAMND